MKFGKYNIELIDTGLFRLDGGSMFGVVPKVMWSKLYNSGDELNRIPLASRPMLVEFENRKILIDTGNGDKWAEKYAEIYQIDVSKSRLEVGLSRLGILPKDITDVILTHLHFDHAGGGTEKVSGELRPTFENAKYYVQKDQMAWAMNPVEKDRASYLSENFQPLIEHNKIELLDGSGELIKGLNLELVHGHTRAMQIIRLETTEGSIVYPADLSATSKHVPAAFVMGYDNEPLLGIEEKKSIFGRAYEEKSIVIFEHDAYVQSARIISTSKGFLAGDEIIITNFD